MIGIRDIARGLQSLGLTRDSGVVVHASLSALGPVRGGAHAVLAALLWECGTVVMPAFTCQSMVWPLVGPSDNGMTYGSPEHAELNRDAIVFHPTLPAHRETGLIAETLRRQPITLRSSHPVLSFVAAGKHAPEVIASQTLDHPFAPIEWLQHHDGDVLLIGVGHACNTGLHLAEKLAGRKQFLRWAIARDDSSLIVRATRLPNFPGCPDGFDAIEPEIAHAAQQATIGEAVVQRIPLRLLIPIAVGWISEEPDALLCSRPDCQRCNDVRRSRASANL